MIITRTPVRLSFLGGGTDYPAWFHKHGGMVVGAAIDKHSYITARVLKPFHPYKTRVVYSTIETVSDHRDIQHKSLNAALRYVGLGGDDAPGLEIFHAADLPGRSGTGSSSTFVVGLVNALASLSGRWMSPPELTAAAIEIEQQMLGETVGCQDQAWAAHGGLNVIKFKPSGDISVYPLPLGRPQITALQAHLMLFFTGISRTSSDVAGTYAPSLGTREREQLAMMALAESGANAVLRGDHEELGRLIDRSWRIKAGLAEGVCPDSVDRQYAAALEAGAWGGKLTGAGGGGCMLLVAPPERHPEIVRALGRTGAMHIPFSIDWDGSRIIFSNREGIRGS